MREVVIVISDLYLASRDTETPPQEAPAVVGLPGIEQAARFGRRQTLNGDWRAWLAHWLGRADLATVSPAVIAGRGASAPLGALAAPASSDATVSRAAPHETAPPSSLQAATVWFATPVYLIAGLTSLHLDRRSLLSLPPDQLQQFAEDFARTFGTTEFTLKSTASGEFLMQTRDPMTAATTEPARALVNDLDAALPTGKDAPALRRLGAEVEMWLHRHPLNEARKSKGELPVSTLWFWGGGATMLPSAVDARASGVVMPVTHAHVPSNVSPSRSSDLALGTDAYLTGLWHVHGGELRPLPDQLVLNASAATRVVLVTEVTPLLRAHPYWTLFEALADLDRRFVTPAMAALHRGVMDSVVLIANDIELRIRRHDRLKFWRRARPGIAGFQS